MISRNWSEDFDQFRPASGLTTNDAKKQASALFYCQGEVLESVLNSTDISDEERKDYNTVIAKLISFFILCQNVILERARFNQCNQLKGEMAKQFVMELYRLADSCEYENLKDDMIHNRLLVGICDNALSQQLQLILN